MTPAQFAAWRRYRALKERARTVGLTRAEVVAALFLLALPHSYEAQP